MNELLSPDLASRSYPIVASKDQVLILSSKGGTLEPQSLGIVCVSSLLALGIGIAGTIVTLGALFPCSIIILSHS